MKRIVPARWLAITLSVWGLQSAIAEGARPDFQPYQVIDQAQGGMVVGTFAVPKDWKAASRVDWKYSDVSFPVRISARFDAPDGSGWLQTYPAEMFYWLEPQRDTRNQVGATSLGMIHKPGITIQEAMQRFVIARYRGKQQNLKLVGSRPIPNLAEALGKPKLEGESIALRVRYTAGGHTVDEDFFGLLTPPLRIPFHGPQGTTYEIHRVLQYVHSMGAIDGKLDGMHPVMGYIESSFKVDPTWEKHSAQVYRKLSEQFNQQMARGYAQIEAAGAASRAISANNDSMIRSLDAQRQAANVSSQQRRAAANASSGSSSADDFSGYLRGTEKMKDPYWGTSDQSYTDKYHWTDGQGNYQHSNDPGFDPNRGSNQNWQRMESAR
jgi:hypothetical protein